MNVKEMIKRNRLAIKPQWTDLRDVETDRAKGLERPPLFKKPNKERKTIHLSTDFSSINQLTVQEAIKRRRSLRQYQDEFLSAIECSYILHETSRVDEVRNNAVFRTIPTGGATNGMETYVYIHRVEGIPQGLYHYVQDEHCLALVNDQEDISEKVHESILHQLRNANMVIYFTAVPYRSEYKYSFAAHKMLMIEAGHAGQNASLASEVVGCGAVCIAAYDQVLCDQLLQIDGEEEFTSYVVALGKRAK